MDARMFDRPTAILRGTRMGIDQAIVGELMRRGYDVHFPSDLLPAVAEAPHPRLHPDSGWGGGLEDQGAVGLPHTLATSIRDRGSPLALVVCAHPCDFTVQLDLLSRFMTPLRTAGLLVLDDSLRARSVSPVLLPATLDPRILISTVPTAGDPRWARRTTRWALEQLLAKVTR